MIVDAGAKAHLASSFSDPIEPQTHGAEPRVHVGARLHASWRKYNQILGAKYLKEAHGFTSSFYDGSVLRGIIHGTAKRNGGHMKVALGDLPFQTRRRQIVCF